MGRLSSPQLQKEMIDELTEFQGRNARDIADQIEAEEAKSTEEAIRNIADMPDPDDPTAELSPAEFADLEDAEMSSAEITAELEAEANPLPVSLPAFLTEVAPDRERVEREVIDSIKLATATAILYNDECSDIYYEESVKAKELGISSERFHELDRIASKESREERREEYRKDDEDYISTCRLDAPDREEEGDPRDEYTYLDSDWRG